MATPDFYGIKVPAVKHKSEKAANPSLETALD